MNKRVSFFLLGWIVPAFAQEPMVALYGWGGESCGRWLEVRRAGPRADDSLKQWVLGYVTAYNTFVAPNRSVFDGADAAVIMALVDNQCLADPRMLIAPAVATVVRAEE